MTQSTVFWAQPRMFRNWVYRPPKSCWVDYGANDTLSPPLYFVPLP